MVKRLLPEATEMVKRLLPEDIPLALTGETDWHPGHAAQATPPSEISVAPASSSMRTIPTSAVTHQ
ncbi:hypothetical protein ACFV19_32130 [Streptomyces griseoluteus]|uniref:hypothetical protein n=1 Tax=Streptomyces griseoluteus TaxID=29306 RepID=UPI00369D1A83